MDDDEESKSVWFRERLFGYGYGPVSWQGWLATALLVIFIVGTPRLVEFLVRFFHLSGPWWLAVLALSIVYIGVFYRVVYTHRGPW